MLSLDEVLDTYGVSEAAARVYVALGRLTDGDAERALPRRYGDGSYGSGFYGSGGGGGPLLRYIVALTLALAELDETIRDVGDFPGWSSVLDVDRAPIEWLPWLGQFVGVDDLVSVDTIAARRSLLISPRGWARGTVAAIREAAQRFLVGSRAVKIYERFGDAYTLRVDVVSAEVPVLTYDELSAEYPTYPDLEAAFATYDDFVTPSQKIRNAVLAAKPAGLVLDFRIVAGDTYDELGVAFPTYDGMSSALSDYDATTTSTA